MAESKMAEFKMAAIIKLSQNEWVKFLSANGGNQWMSEVSFVQMVGREVWVKCFLCKWWEPILPSVSEFERKN